MILPLMVTEGNRQRRQSKKTLPFLLINQGVLFFRIDPESAEAKEIRSKKKCVADPGKVVATTSALRM